MQCNDVGEFSYETEALRLAGEGKLLQAAGCYRRAAQLASVSAVAVPLLFQLADLYDVMGYTDEQISTLEQIIADHPIKPNVVSEAKERLANALVDGRGDRHGAMDLYRDIAETSPTAPAFLRQSCVAAFEGNFDLAARCQVNALNLDDRIADTVLYLQAGAASCGRSVDEHVRMNSNCGPVAVSTSKLPNFMQKSWEYVCSSGVLPRSPWLYAYTYDMLHLGMAAAHIEDGVVIECGVFHGKTIRMIAAHWPDIQVHGFDTFEGLPEQWGNEPAGSYSTHGHLPRAPKNVVYHKGLFSETLTPFVADHHEPVRFLNVDCDLYSSTVDILQVLNERIVPGTVIVFDEYVMYSNWQLDEFLAFKEAVDRYGWHYEYLGISLVSKQAVVRIVES